MPIGKDTIKITDSNLCEADLLLYDVEDFVTSVVDGKGQKTSVIGLEGAIQFSGKIGQNVTVFDLKGSVVQKASVSTIPQTISILKKGYYVVSVGTQRVKVLVK